jgi:hypothetical protein
MDPPPQPESARKPEQDRSRKIALATLERSAKDLAQIEQYGFWSLLVGKAHEPCSVRAERGTKNIVGTRSTTAQTCELQETGTASKVALR